MTSAARRQLDAESGGLDPLRAPGRHMIRRLYSWQPITQQSGRRCMDVGGGRPDGRVRARLLRAPALPATTLGVALLLTKALWRHR